VPATELPASRSTRYRYGKYRKLASNSLLVTIYVPAIQVVANVARGGGEQVALAVCTDPEAGFGVGGLLRVALDLIGATLADEGAHVGGVTSKTFSSISALSLLSGAILTIRTILTALTILTIRSRASRHSSLLSGAAWLAPAV
jgi:hypothetical protein